MTDTSNDADTNSDVDVNADNSTSGTVSGATSGATGLVGSTVNSATNATANVTAAADVRSVQESLRDAGHSISVDGVMGPQTKAALRDFQQQNGLSVTGTLNSETVSALQSR